MNNSRYFIAALLVLLAVLPSAHALVNITVVKTAAASTVQVPLGATFTINVTNIGDENATNLTLLDTFDISYINYTGANTTPQVIDYGLGELEWFFNLTPNASFIVQVNFTTIRQGTTANNATVENSTADDVAVNSTTLTITGGYEDLWNNAQPARFFPEYGLFSFSGAPYVARGNGCYREPTFASSYSTAGQNCCSTKSMNGGDGCNGANNTAYDLGAVFVEEVGEYIGWYIVGPFGANTTNMSICDGTNRDVAFVVEFDIDNNMSTGCDNDGPDNNPGTQNDNDACYPGSDYQIWFFPDTNETLFANYTGKKASGISFGANVSLSANATWVHYNCSILPTKQRGLAIIVNKTAAFGGLTPKLNFETNTFNVSEAAANPIDMLTNFGGGQSFDNFVVTGPGEDKGKCFQFDDNQAGCTNSSDDFVCRWTDFGGGKGLCDPDFDSFSQGTTCFTLGQAQCNDNANNGIGYCRWEASLTLPNGSTGLCVEEFKPFEFSSGDCDTDCFNCFSQAQCTGSNANGGQEYGGCQWYNDSFRSDGWCDVKGLKQGCALVSGDCLSQSACTSAGWHWNGTWSFCVDAPGTEICFNGVDDDGDGTVDCDDASCDKSRSCGGHINTLTGTYKGMDPEEALQQKFFVGMGPVLQLKQDDTGDAPNNSVDIGGFGVVISTFGIGMGMMVNDLSDLIACGGSTRDRKTLFLVDNDVNASSGCNITLDGTVRTGYEYMIKYGNYSVANESANETFFYACYQGQWVVREASVDPVLEQTNPMDPDAPEFPMECGGSTSAIALMMEKADIGNPKADIRFLAAIINGSYADVNDLRSYDIIDETYYTPGSQGFTPVDCFQEPTKCGAEFMIMGGGNYMPAEECIAPADEDADGLTNCADPDCAFAPHCAGQNGYNASADKTAPKVTLSSVKTFNNLAVVKWVTNEPTNGSVRYYGNDSGCNNLNATIIDLGLPSVSFDDYKPWHDVPLDDRTLGALLSANTAYYYKLVSTDIANNTATSACLNFTTAAAASNVSMLFNFSGTGNANDFLGSLEIKVNGNALDIGSAVQRNPSSDRNVNISFSNPNATLANNWSVTLVGADFSQQMVIDLNDAFIANQTNATHKVVGMENDDWLTMAQKIGADYVLLRIPEGKDGLFHCADNGSSCTNVTGTEGVQLIENGTNHTVWRVPTTLGFSTYSAQGSQTSGGSSGGSGNAGGAGSSGGGGGGSGDALHGPAAELGAVLERTLSRYGTYSFRLAGSTVEHRLRISQINADSVVFLIQSDPVQVTLRAGETKGADLDGDGLKDIVLTLVSFTQEKVTFRIGLAQPAPKDPPLVTGDAIFDERNEVEVEAELLPTLGGDAAPAPDVVVPEESGVGLSGKTIALTLLAIVLAVAVVNVFRKNFFRRPPYAGPPPEHPVQQPGAHPSHGVHRK